MIVDGNQLIMDLRSGMQDYELIRKYNLSESELRELLNELSKRFEYYYEKTSRTTKSHSEKINESFRRIAYRTSDAAGSPIAFTSAVLLFLIWALLGPFLNYSDTWLLIVNTLGNTGVFLTVFLIQNTQNRHAKAVQLKLNELVMAVEGARRKMVAVEHLPDHELKEIEEEFLMLGQQVEDLKTPIKNDED
jgi:low affinity Fe/Cu permease